MIIGCQVVEVQTDQDDWMLNNGSYDKTRLIGYQAIDEVPEVRSLQSWQVEVNQLLGKVDVLKGGA